MVSEIQLLRLLPRTANAVISWASARRPGLGVLFVLVGIASLLLDVLAPRASVDIPPAEIRADAGAGFIGPVRHSPRSLYVLPSDGVGKNASTLRLLEDGRELTPPHAPHADIRAHGGGRFSHWGGSLWFSASDNSDPRTNGRTYAADAKLALRPDVMAASWLLSLAGAVLLLRGAVTDGRREILIARPVRALTGPVLVAPGPAAAVVLAGVLGGTAAIVLGWLYGGVATTSFDLVRFLPISDALGYQNCAASLAASGSFTSHASAWCSRRVLYPAMLATLFGASGWSPQVTLLIQAGLVGGAIAVFAVALRQRCGLLAAAMAVTALVAFAWEHVLGLFMTEVAGLLLGLSALTLFLAYALRQHPALLFAACAFLSVGLTARAGALFALPIVGLWAVLTAAPLRARAIAGVAALAGLLVGPALQSFVVAAIGGELANTGGNFSASLYGLSTGSRDWSEAYRFFEASFPSGEDAAFREIYRAAIEHIRADPGVFVGALFGAAVDYLRSLFDLGVLRPAGSLLSAFAAVGLLVCIGRIAKKQCSIVVALAAAELFSAPFIYDSGGTRVFAVTFPVRAVLAGLGASWLVQACAAVRDTGEEHRAAHRSLIPLAASTTLGAAVVAAMLVVATPLARWMHLRPVEATGVCPEGSQRAVVRLDRESQMIGVAASAASQTIFPFRISPDRLLSDAGLATSPFGKEIQGLSAGNSLVLAVERAPGRIGVVTPLLVAHDSLPLRAGPVSLCFIGSEGHGLANVFYSRVIGYARGVGE